MNPSPLPYRPDIEGLRAVAILLVVLDHAGVPGFGGGFVGVDVFFVISGYLITRILAQPRPPRLRDFYAARARRLLPALFAMLFVSALLAMLLLAPVEQVAQARAAGAASLWLSNFWFAANGQDYFAAGAEDHLFQHTWSLGVEEQFYLLWPALILAFATRARRVRLASLALVLAASLALCVAGTSSMPLESYYLLPARFWQFAAGGLLSLALEGGEARITHRVALATGTLGGLLLLAAVMVFDGVGYPGWQAVVPTAASLALLVSGLHAKGTAARVLSIRPAQWIGQRSYGWYLWHWPLVLLAPGLSQGPHPAIALVASALALGVAAISYRWIEQPVRRSSRLAAWPRATLVASVMMLGIGWLAAELWQRAAERWEQAPDQRRYLRITADLPRLYRFDCDDFHRAFREPPCTFGDPQAARTLAIAGDSVALQWFPAFERAFASSGWRIVVLTKSSCPMVVAGHERPGARPDCEAWRDSALAYLSRLRPEVLVVGSAGAAGPVEPAGIERKRLARLADSTGRLYLLAPTPILRGDGPACLARHAWRPSWLVGRGGCVEPRVEPPGQDAALARLVDGLANASVIDLNDEVCPGGQCRAERSGLIVFRDRLHLSAEFAESLAEEMVEAMAIER
jgi:peptidoglycan/LPS O-acetylase OafA/YrhL